MHFVPCVGRLYDYCASDDHFVLNDAGPYSAPNTRRMLQTARVQLCEQFAATLLAHEPHERLPLRLRLREEFGQPSAEQEALFAHVGTDTLLHNVAPGRTARRDDG
jgi:hypothetical protein